MEVDGLNDSSGLFQNSIQASELASLLFTQRVRADEHIIMSSQLELYKNEPEFKSDVFEQKVFLYLVANVALALMNFSDKNKKMQYVIAHFKKLVSLEMHNRWDYTQEKIDDVVEATASKYAILLYTKPDEDRSLSFEWPKQWLEDVGIRETNPITLFKISTRWIIYHIDLLEFLSKQKITNG